MGRRSIAVGMFGSIEDAKDLLRAHAKLKSDFEQLIAEGKRHDAECLQLVDMMEYLQGRLESARKEAEGHKAISATFEEEARKERDAHRQTKEELRAARAQVAVLHQGKLDVEAENKDLETRIDHIRSLMHDQPGAHHLSGQISGLLDRAPKRDKLLTVPKERDSCGLIDDVDYDQSESSLDVLEVSTLRNGRQWVRSGDGLVDGRKRSSKRRSKSTTAIRPTPSAPPAKAVTSTEVKTEVHFPADGSAPTGTFRVEKRRSQSESRLPMSATRLNGGSAYRSNLDLRSPRREATWLTSGCAIAAKEHTFLKATNLKPEGCHYCAKRIHFGTKAYKCDDCKYLSHSECRTFVPLPCVPRPLHTPNAKAGRGAKIDLSGQVPPMRPKIPPLIIHCVTEMDRRGSNEMGLYRVPGGQMGVINLAEQFLGGRGGAPDVSRIDDIHILASTVKHFLSRLVDPLIPSTSLHEFMDAAEANDNCASLDKAICDLPVPHRDTLAFLALHWARVTDNADLTRMPREQLAKVLAPTVCGHRDGLGLGAAMDENTRLIKVMEAILCIGKSYWEGLLELGGAHPLLNCPVQPRTPANNRYQPNSPSVHLNNTLGGGNSTFQTPGNFFSKPKY